MGICSECKKNTETRPYGENFSDICYDCGMKNESRTKKNFTAQLEGCGEVAILDSSAESGPVPLKKS